MSVKVSSDQNFIKIDGIRGMFVKSDNISCNLCCYCDINDHCAGIPCRATQRNDKKNGYFRGIE